MQLVEATAIILTLDIAQDVLEQLLDASESRVEESSDLVLSCHFLEQLRVASVALRGLVLEILEDGVGSLVCKLEAATEVDELRGHACVH
jgi:hypothetical protein